MNRYLTATPFIESQHPDILEFAHRVTQNCTTPQQKARALYYAVRDEIAYNSYKIAITQDKLCASYTLNKKEGHCVQKGIVMASAARALDIPTRLGFANVRNHLATEKFLEVLQTDVFVFHGYVSLWLDEKWVKATPAFDKKLCDRFQVKPLDFDGINDSIFQEYNQEGAKYMEYLHFHGEFDDMPLDLFVQELQTYYPHIFAQTK